MLGKASTYKMDSKKQKYIRKITYNVSENFEGRQLRDVLSSIGYSRNLLQYLKNVQHIRLDTIVHANEEFTIEIEENEDSKNIVPVDIPINIVYEDEDIIVVNKQANLPTHPSLNNHDNTLGNALCYYFRDRNFVYRPINRLDKGTSGLVIVAKNLLAGSLLSKAFINNFIRRTYTGIVSGNLYEVFMHDKNLVEKLKSELEVENIIPANDIYKHIKPRGIVEIPIKREAESLIKRIPAEDGEYAKTTFFPLSYNKQNNTSYVKFILQTGRTHQIRVHMLSLGHPIIGDFLYNPDYSLIDRQALHAGEIIFVHPITRKTMRFIAKTPDDILKLI